MLDEKIPSRVVILLPGVECTDRTFVVYPGRVREPRERRRLGPGDPYDGVHQQGDEPQLGQHLVVLGGQQGLLREVRRGQRAPGVLILLVVAARAPPGGGGGKV